MFIDTNSSYNMIQYNIFHQQHFPPNRNIFHQTATFSTKQHFTPNNNFFNQTNKQTNNIFQKTSNIFHQATFSTKQQHFPSNSNIFHQATFNITQHFPPKDSIFQQHFTENINIFHYVTFSTKQHQATFYELTFYTKQHFPSINIYTNNMFDTIQYQCFSSIHTVNACLPVHLFCHDYVFLNFCRESVFCLAEYIFYVLIS